ncbi:MAG TPA: hypothetical protein EYP58_05015 [bacterium (Candidatus Stahlbacteria)]|nr:hypothetical protein [Candidatus Stahlbacteria bacterium]
MGKKHLIFIFVALVIITFNPYPFLGGDNVVYSILAKSIVTGNGYSSIHKPDSPPHIHYPPGFPIFLAPLVLIFGINMTILKFVPLLGAILAMMIFSKIDWGDEGIPFYSTLLFATSPLIILYSSRVLSEIPFIAVVLASIYFHKRKKYIPAWLMAVAAVYIRSAGLFLTGAYLIFYIARREYQRLLICFSIFICAYLPWYIRNRVVSTEPTYLKQFFMVDPYNIEAGTITPLLFLQRIITNAKLYFLEILPRSFTTIFGQVNYLLGVLLLVLSVAGIIKSGGKNRFTKYVVVLFFLSLLLWPTVWSSDRFLLSGLPLLFPFLVIGARAIAKTYGRYLIISLAVLSIVSTIQMIPVGIEQKIHFVKGDYEFGYSLDWQKFRQVCFWAKDNVNPGVIVSRKPEFTYLWSGYQSNIYPYSYDEEAVWEEIKQYDYILIDSFFWSATTQKYLIPAILKHRTEIKALYRTSPPESWLLRIKHR